METRSRAFCLGLLYLRLFLLTASAIAGYAFCYLIWHHNNHYCSYHPDSCTADQLQNTKVPFQYGLALLTHIGVFLAILLHTPFILVSNRIYFKQHLITDGVAIVFLAITQGLLFSIPGRKPTCNFLDSSSTSIKGPVLNRECIVFVNGEAAHAIVLGLSCVVWLVMFIATVFDRFTKKSTSRSVVTGTDENGGSQYAILPRSRGGLEAQRILEQRSRDRLRQATGSVPNSQGSHGNQEPAQPLHEPDNLRRISLEDGSVSSVDELEHLREMVQVRRNPEAMQPVIHHGGGFQDFDAEFEGSHSINIPIHLIDPGNHRRHLSRISEELPRDVEDLPPTIPPPRQPITSKFREHGEAETGQNGGLANPIK